MKNVLFILMGVFLMTPLFANRGGITPPPPTTKLLVDDRIRNVPAVDPEVFDSSIRFFVTTFGLENVDRFDIQESQRQNAPIPKPATLIRFGIENSDIDWDFTNVIFNSMNEDLFHEPGTTPLNCYTEADRILIYQTYSSQLCYSDGIVRPEAYMRYGSATGFWASPVLYNQGGDNNLLMLNKSGCLISINVSQPSISLNWKVDLRGEERAYDNNSALYEFMATPVIIDGKIYVPGINLLHVIDFSTAVPFPEFYHCAGMQGSNDYFDKPVIFDTHGGVDRSFYFISHLGRPFCFNGTNVVMLSQAALGRSDTQPILDADGHVYFYTKSSNDDIKLHYLEQENRNLAVGYQTLNSVAITNTSSYKPVTASVLTDFTPNQYLMTHNSIIQIKEPYSFTNLVPPDDPTTYNDLFDNYQEYFLDNSGGVPRTRFPGNHALLSYHENTKQSMIYSIDNSNSEQYNADVAHCYPNSESLYDVLQCNVNLTYTGFDYSIGAQYLPVLIYSAEIEQLQSWGGIAPYNSSGRNLLNALFGDECGCITSYSQALASGSIGFNPRFDDGESMIPKMGYTKFMKNLNNIPTNDKVNNFKVYFYDMPHIEDTYVYMNGYVRKTSLDFIPNSYEEAYMAVFDNLLPNKEYQITWKNANNQYQCLNNITVSESNTWCVIGDNQNIMIEDDPVLDPDLETEWLHNVGLNINTVCIMDNAHWRIANGSNIMVDSLRIGDGAKLSIGDNATLTVNYLECESINNAAIIDVDGMHTGSLHIENIIRNLAGSNLRFECYNHRDVSYNIGIIYNHLDANMYFNSCEEAPDQNQISASVSVLRNSGNVYINDCVRLTSGYDDFPNDDRFGNMIIGETGRSFGHLIWAIPEGSIRSDLSVGQTYSAQATLSIENGCECKIFGDRDFPRYIYGTLVIKGDAKCIVTQFAKLKFQMQSSLELTGNLGASRGAELEVRGEQGGRFGTVIFDNDVQISGYKPKPNQGNQTGDRIVTNEYGQIEGVDARNPRILKNLNIISSNPSGARWEGIMINTTQNNGYSFELQSDNQSLVSGISKIYVKDPGSAPIFDGIKFVNCTYGIYYTVEDNLDADRSMEIKNCHFEECKYGIYLEDNYDHIPDDLIFTTRIENCKFGNENGVSGYNSVGIALHRINRADINGCNFYFNSYGIFSLASTVLIGGEYVSTPLGVELAQETPCSFYNNKVAGVYFEQNPNDPQKSLIYENEFSNALASPHCDSGIGIWINGSVVDIVNNVFDGLIGHGMLIRNFNFNPSEDYHGFSNNAFHNNRGSELMGDPASLSALKQGLNIINDEDYSEYGFIPEDPLESFEVWDKFILARISSGGFEQRNVNVSENIFFQDPYNNRERFYPQFDMFLFGQNTLNPLSEIILTGIDKFYQGLFDESIQCMKQAVETYPDSSTTSLAIDFLYLATRASTKDYASLRSYLDHNIPLESLSTYIKKEEIKTQCYIREEDYLTAINRLQLIINNPQTLADSLFALIDQSYCYMNMARSGAKNLPNVSAKTQDFNSYLEFMAQLTSDNSFVSSESHVSPKNIKINSIYPNPFNPEATISFFVPTEAKLKMSIYNVKGQKVKQLINDQMSAGNHKIIWNGTNSRGKRVSSGLYFVKIEQNKAQKVHKMVLLK